MNELNLELPLQIKLGGNWEDCVFIGKDDYNVVVVSKVDEDNKTSFYVGSLEYLRNLPETTDLEDLAEAIRVAADNKGIDLDSLLSAFFPKH